MKKALLIVTLLIGIFSMSLYVYNRRAQNAVESSKPTPLIEVSTDEVYPPENEQEDDGNMPCPEEDPIGLFQDCIPETPEDPNNPLGI